MDRLLAFPGGTVPAEAVTWRFDPSGGPGGQHANRSSTRVEAVLDLTTARDVVPAARERLIDQFGAELRVVVDDTRSQARNRDIALDRLQARLRDGVAVIKPRKPTRPTMATRRTRRVAATAWLAPLPPGMRRRSPPSTVSPATESGI